ncbi:MAG: helix-turn-helix domain-containing protein [Ruminococcus sp.]|nr:helix-turn-helix domain-containing protein [Ruminococcus sp.]
MQLTNIGFDHIKSPDFFVSRPKGSEDNLFILLHSPGIFTVKGEEIKASAGSFIIYSRGTPQFYRADSCKNAGTVITGKTVNTDISIKNGTGGFISERFYFTCTEDEHRELTDMGISFDRVVKTGDTAELSELIRKMCREYYSDNPFKERSLDLYLRLFFVKLGEASAKKGVRQPVHCSEMNRIRSMVYSTAGRMWTAEELAEELGVSLSYFEHTYRKIFGVSPLYDIISARIEYAEFMLSTTDVPVSVICNMCGYRNGVHFLRQFRARTGCTPTEYRRKEKR